MPHEINLGFAAAGYSRSAARPNEYLEVEYEEFISSEDGQEFILKLEGLPSLILNRLPVPAHIRPSQVDHLLAIIRRDQTATVYVNELPIRMLIRANRAIAAYAPIRKDDIADIAEVDFGPVTVPDDAGVVLVFSESWRKGLYYDFGPLLPGAAGPRTCNLRALFGQFYARLLFQERFSILEAEWNRLLAAQWFPFIGLSNDRIDGLLCHLRAGWNLDEVTETVVNEVAGKTTAFLDSWRTHPAFSPHMDILARAAERFAAGDYVSCTGLLFPRIEGIMRTNLASGRTTEKPTQVNLSASAVRAKVNSAGCLLLPRMFERYLQQVYFAAFDPKDASIGVSRNSVGHGVADPGAFSAKTAVIGLLVVNQLFHCFEPVSVA